MTIKKLPQKEQVSNWFTVLDFFESKYSYSHILKLKNNKTGKIVKINVGSYFLRMKDK